MKQKKKINKINKYKKIYLWLYLIGDEESLIHGVIFKALRFFVAYNWAQKARVFVTGKSFWPSVINRSSLLGLFVSYEVL
jgi:hypothetical protein